MRPVSVSPPLVRWLRDMYPEQSAVILQALETARRRGIRHVVRMADVEFDPVLGVVTSEVIFTFGVMNLIAPTTPPNPARTSYISGWTIDGWDADLVETIGIDRYLVLQHVEVQLRQPDRREGRDLSNMGVRFESSEGFRDEDRS